MLLWPLVRVSRRRFVGQKILLWCIWALSTFSRRWTEFSMLDHRPRWAAAILSTAMDYCWAVAVESRERTRWMDGSLSSKYVARSRARSDVLTSSADITVVLVMQRTWVLSRTVRELLYVKFVGFFFEKRNHSNRTKSFFAFDRIICRNKKSPSKKAKENSTVTVKQ